MLENPGLTRASGTEINPCFVVGSGPNIVSPSTSGNSGVGNRAGLGAGGGFLKNFGASGTSGGARAIF